ncbi:MAG TPA: Gfo/Idh/MocA family oxidoreductase [Chloroflexota bacterium]
MTAARVRVGVIGCGDIAFRRYLPGFAEIPEQAEVVALHDPDGVRMAAAATQYGGRPLASLEELLSAQGVDAVLNLTPPRLHGSVTLSALRAGKHVMVEKPIAGTVAEADVVIAEAAARGLVLVCAPAIAINAFMVDVRRLVHDGAIGDVTHARAQLATFGPAAWMEYTSDPTWFYQRGAGPLVDLGVYMLHALTEVLGPVRRLSAFGAISIPTRTVLAGPARGKEISVELEDNIQALLEFELPGREGPRPAFAHLDASYCTWTTPGPMIEIYGSEGVLVVDNIYDERGTIRLWRGGKGGARAWEIVPPISPSAIPNRGKHIFAGASHLVACVRTGRAPLLSAEHARHVLEVMLLATEAAHSRKTLDTKTTFAFPKQWGAWEE